VAVRVVSCGTSSTAGNAPTLSWARYLANGRARLYQATRLTSTAPKPSTTPASTLVQCLPLVVNYCPALASSGSKTRALVRRATAMALEGHRVAVVMPTVELIRASVENELRTLPRVRIYRVIDSETVKNQSVTSTIIEHLMLDPGDGQVLSITHQAFALIRDWHRKKDWRLILDEEPQITRCHHHDDVAHTHCHITDHVIAEPREDVPGYAELRVTNRDALTRVVQNRGCDAHFAKLGDLARDLTSPHRDKFVEIKEYRNLKYAQDFDESHHLTVLSVLSPNAIRGFASCSYFYSQVIF
jgi:hypothetical protein